MKNPRKFYDHSEGRQSEFHSRTRWNNEWTPLGMSSLPGKSAFQRYQMRRQQTRCPVALYTLKQRKRCIEISMLPTLPTALISLTSLNRCYCSCNRNEAKGSIQSRIDPLASFACQSFDHFDKSCLLLRSRRAVDAGLILRLSWNAFLQGLANFSPLESRSKISNLMVAWENERFRLTFDWRFGTLSQSEIRVHWWTHN